ncbi:hypothetical protein OG563_38270 [Nocardia vinacea]|uniref:Uncharacterized protein n=1 Tax=Nocardia vinacea TaxID=96468 RepID=A0ABZ1YT63_9NOCA|nr:hypothetical protein [Nocardia vinacea]
MATKAERQAARGLVAAYHEAQLGVLVEHVGRAVDRFRASEQDAFEVDAAIHQFHRAARQLWSFCAQSGTQVESTAYLIERMANDGDGIDWWQRGAPAKALGAVDPDA